MTEDEITAFHEAAHAVYAAFGTWTKLAGPVALAPEGCGDVVMSTNAEAIRRNMLAERGFDRELPRIELIGALLAGPVAERMLRESGRAALRERDLSETSRNDREVARDQLNQIVPPRPGLLEKIERDVRQRLEQPEIWAAIEDFAAILLERRRLEADEATAILERMRPAAKDDGSQARRIELSPAVITLIVFVGFAITAILRLIG